MGRFFFRVTYGVTKCGFSHLIGQSPTPAEGGQDWLALRPKPPPIWRELVVRPDYARALFSGRSKSHGANSGCALLAFLYPPRRPAPPLCLGNALPSFGCSRPCGHHRQLPLAMTPPESQAETDIDCNGHILWPTFPNISHVANAPAFSRFWQILRRRGVAHPSC